MTPTTIQVYLHDGNVILATVDSYNAEELAATMNDQKVLMISVGNIVVNKNVVKYIAPVQLEV
jgi:exopolysaccharide biosynthesis protein